MAEDDDLLAGVTSGEPDWDGIYRAHHQGVHAAAQKVFRSRRRIVDSKDVDDVVQQTFEEAMKGGVLTSETRSIGATLRQVARRRAIDAIRRAAKVHDQPVEETAGAADEDEDEIEQLIESEFEVAIQQAVWRNLRRLTPQERTVFRARATDGLKFPQIAERLGLTPQRVGQIYRDALGKVIRGLDLTGYGGDAS